MSRESVLAMAEGSAPARVRLDWLDALKGIGIVAVVVGHVMTHGALRNVIYCFHMPLFFMTSGAVARATPMRVLAPRLLVALGLPALSFALLFLALDPLIEGARHLRPIFPDLRTAITTLLFATEQLRGPFAILWFAPCLIVARLIWNALQHRFTRDGLGMFAVMAAVLALALLVDAYGHRSPFGLLPVPAALLFIWLGAHWRARLPGPWLGAACLVVGLAALAWMPPLNMRAADLGWPVLGIVGAAAIVDRLGWAMRHLPGLLARPLASIGRNSLAIMFMHLGFTHYLWRYAPAPVLILLGVCGPLLLARLLRRNRLSRLVFLGER